MSEDPYYEAKRRWQETHKEQWRLDCQKWRKEHPEHSKEYMKKWNVNHPNRSNGNITRTPEQGRAHNYVQKHPEILGFKCEKCSSTENLCGHHPDYSKPLEVVTVCASCHNFIHKGVD